MMSKEEDKTDENRQKKFVCLNHDDMWRTWYHFIGYRVDITICVGDHHAFTFRNDLLFIASGMVITS